MQPFQMVYVFWIEFRSPLDEGNKDIHYDLVLAAKDYDASAQYQLYSLYSKAMLNVSFRILNDVQDAEDVLQEAFVTAFNKLSTFRGESTFGGWLKRIVINASLNVLKKRKVPYESIEDSGIEDIEEETVVRSELSVEQIRKAVQVLPDGFRVVFSLYAMEGYDHREISEILNISESTSKSQYNRAKKKLQVIIKEKYSYEG